MKHASPFLARVPAFKSRFVLALVLLSTISHQPSTGFAQGSLTPPGAPAPTMKSLDQVEPPDGYFEIEPLPF